MLGLSYFWYISLNIFLALDLTYEIRAPLQSKEKRIKIYYCISFVIALAPAIAEFREMHERKSKDTADQGSDILGYSIRCALCLSLLTLYFFVSICSLIYCAIRIRNSSLSSLSRKLILIRHCYWVLVVYLSNAYVFYFNLYIVVRQSSAAASDYKTEILIDTSGWLYETLKYLCFG